MRVMPSNSGKAVVHMWAGKYPGALGHLYGPGGQRGPFDWLPHALDNGAYGAFARGVPFDADPFVALLRWADAATTPPLWVVVPDVVGDRDATLRAWETWAPTLRRYGWPLALAVQDGMTPSDAADSGCDVVFVGGSTDWKRRQLCRLAEWRAAVERVHVARINTGRWLWLCAEAGAESCDGTGWFRGDPAQLNALSTFLDQQARGVLRRCHGPLFAGQAA